MLQQKSTSTDRFIKRHLKFRFAISLVFSILFAGNSVAQNLNRRISKHKDNSITTLSKSESLDSKDRALVSSESELKSGKESESPFDAVKGKKEDVSKRDLFSKHYINEDGSFTALIGSGPIHYLKDGSYEDIETKIISQTDVAYSFGNKSKIDLSTQLKDVYLGTVKTARNKAVVKKNIKK